jgi:threonine dehydrogenase-like Zn-dependent dehydrogenase
VRVLYLDDNPGNRDRAATLGADVAPLQVDWSDQFEIVVEAAGSEAALGFAIRSCAPNGIVTSVAMHLGKTTAFPLAQAYYKGLTFHTSRASARRWLPDVLACIACGRLHPEHVTHRVLPFSEAADAMADPGPKLVFTP